MSTIVETFDCDRCGATVNMDDHPCFDNWYERYRAEALKKGVWFLALIEQKEAFREYWADGDSPEDALATEVSYCEK